MTRSAVTVRRLAYERVAMALFLSGLSAVVCVSCATATSTRSGIDEAADAQDAQDAQADRFVSGDVSEGDAGADAKAAECADETKDIFVIAADSTLYSFHPPTLEFTIKGILNCPAGGPTPTSMAVDRDGIAWVRHSDGTVWKVSTKDLSCEATKYQPQAGGDFTKFGMGFATETKGGSTEVLYLSDSNGAGLAKLDTSTLALTFIGPYTGDLAGTTSELTGTGDGKLYGFFVTSPAQIGEISKATGGIINPKPLPGVYAGNCLGLLGVRRRLLHLHGADGGTSRERRRLRRHAVSPVRRQHHRREAADRLQDRRRRRLDLRAATTR